MIKPSVNEIISITKTAPVMMTREDIMKTFKVGSGKVADIYREAQQLDFKKNGRPNLNTCTANIWSVVEVITGMTKQEIIEISKLRGEK